MRRLIYVPIIHMSADLGSIAKQVDKRGIAGFGEEFWKRHREIISGFWDLIVKYFANLEVKDFKIYQDGLAGFIVLRDRVLIPLLAGACNRKPGRKPINRSQIDIHYENIQSEMQNIFETIGIAA